MLSPPHASQKTLHRLGPVIYDKRGRQDGVEIKCPNSGRPINSQRHTVVTITTPAGHRASYVRSYTAAAEDVLTTKPRTDVSG
jgi:hypothetical protein